MFEKHRIEVIYLGKTPCGAHRLAGKSRYNSVKM